MTLTTKQEEGLKIAIDRYRNGEKYTVIAGYAGTGKSTLIKYLVEALLNEDSELNPAQIVYSSFTGKACQVLIKKGHRNVITLHRLLYDSRPKIEGGFARFPRKELGCKIVIVDEISMVPKELTDLLLKHPVHVIACGDPFQLPPVDEKSDNHLLDRPHIFLDEVMRQAEESEIVRLSMKIRNKESFEQEFRKGSEVAIYEHKELTLPMCLWADQVLAATNQTRRQLNKEIRAAYGRSGNPQNGDKIICNRNYWDELSDNHCPLVNGAIGYIGNGSITNINLPYWVKAENKNLPVLVMDFQTDYGDKFFYLKADAKKFETEENTLDWKTVYALNKSVRTQHLVPFEFIYGYAITCHKAQGSEWDKVLVYEEGFPFDREEHARWLYTAVTRASEKLVLVR